MKRLRAAVVPGLLLAFLACCAGFSVAFTAASADGGLITPDATPDPVAVVLGLGTLTLRLGLLFVVVPLTAGWAVRRLLRRGAA